MSWKIEKRRKLFCDGKTEKTIPYKRNESFFIMEKMLEMKELIIHRQFSHEDEYLIDIFILTIPGKLTSDIMKILCEITALQIFQLSHLKRVQKSVTLKDHVDIILCPVTYYESLRLEIENKKSISDLPEKEEENNEFHEKISVFKSLEDIRDKQAISWRQGKAAKYPPENRIEFELWNKHWPINFHPGELERQRQKPFTTEEMKTFQEFHEILEKEMEINHKEFELMNFGAFLVNPLNNQILCRSSTILEESSREGMISKILKNPLLSPALLCIEELALMAQGIKPGRGKRNS